MAEGRVQEAGPKIGKTSVKPLRTHTADMHNDILESFETSLELNSLIDRKYTFVLPLLDATFSECT